MNKTQLMPRNYYTTVFKHSVAALRHCESQLGDYELIISDACIPEHSSNQLTMQRLKINPTKRLLYPVNSPARQTDTTQTKQH